MPGKHHYFLAKDIKDAIAKHLAEIIFGRAEGQISSATVSAITVCHAKTNDIHVWINHDVFIYFLFLFSTDVMKSLFLLFFSKEKTSVYN